MMEHSYTNMMFDMFEPRQSAQIPYVKKHCVFCSAETSMKPEFRSRELYFKSNSFLETSSLKGIPFKLETSGFPN